MTLEDRSQLQMPLNGITDERSDGRLLQKLGAHSEDDSRQDTFFTVNGVVLDESPTTPSKVHIEIQNSESKIIGQFLLQRHSAIA